MNDLISRAVDLLKATIDIPLPALWEMDRNQFLATAAKSREMVVRIHGGNRCGWTGMYGDDPDPRCNVHLASAAFDSEQKALENAQKVGKELGLTVRVEE